MASSCDYTGRLINFLTEHRRKKLQNILPKDAAELPYTDLIMDQTKMQGGRRIYKGSFVIPDKDNISYYKKKWPELFEDGYLKATDHRKLLFLIQKVATVHKTYIAMMGILDKSVLHTKFDLDLKFDDETSIENFLDYNESSPLGKFYVAIQSIIKELIIVPGFEYGEDIHGHPLVGFVMHRPQGYNNKFRRNSRIYIV